MIDDPLGLVVQAIIVMAAGMYPVGFLFGVCSDCCCPACSLCSSAYIGCVPTSVTLTFGGDSHTYTSDDWNEFYFTDQQSPTFPITLFSGVDCEGQPLTVEIGMENFVIDTVADECGCLVCTFRLGYQTRIDWGEDPPGTPRVSFAFGESPLPPPYVTQEYAFKVPNYCEGSPIEIAFKSEFFDGIQDWWAFFHYPRDCHPAGLTDSVLTVELDFDTTECDCGACCVNGDCIEEVPETHCESEGGLSGSWQGVGTTCDPNPC